MRLSFWLASESPQGPLRLGGILNLHKDFVSVEWARTDPSYKKMIGVVTAATAIIINEWKLPTSGKKGSVIKRDRS
jgi:hypothetical protein